MKDTQYSKSQQNAFQHLRELWRNRNYVPGEFTIDVNSVMVKGKYVPTVPIQNQTISNGQLTFIDGLTELGQTALGLMLAGRMKPDSGDVLINGKRDMSMLQRMTVLIDAPFATAPDDNMPLGAVIGEELAIAKRASSIKATKEFLESHNALEYRKTAIDSVPVEIRLKLLLESASLRKDAKVLILVAPDRFVISKHIWVNLAKEYNAKGFTVIVLCKQSPPGSAAMKAGLPS